MDEFPIGQLRGVARFLIGWRVSTGPWRPRLSCRRQSPSDVRKSELRCLYLHSLNFFLFFFFHPLASAERDRWDSQVRSFFCCCLFVFAFPHRSSLFATAVLHHYDFSARAGRTVHKWCTRSTLHRTRCLWLLVKAKRLSGFMVLVLLLFHFYFLLLFLCVKTE